MRSGVGFRRHGLFWCSGEQPPQPDDKGDGESGGRVAIYRLVHGGGICRIPCREPRHGSGVAKGSSYPDLRWMVWWDPEASRISGARKSCNI